MRRCDSVSHYMAFIEPTDLQ